MASPSTFRADDIWASGASFAAEASFRESFELAFGSYLTLPRRLTTSKLILEGSFKGVRLFLYGTAASLAAPPLFGAVSPKSNERSVSFLRMRFDRQFLTVFCEFDSHERCANF